MESCIGCEIARIRGRSIPCDECVFRSRCRADGRRHSRRLAVKPAVNYYEAPEVPQRIQRIRDQRARLRGGLTWHEFVAAVRAECDCTYGEAMREAGCRMRGEEPRTAADFAEGRERRMVNRALRAMLKAEEAARRQEERNRERAVRLLERMERELAAPAPRCYLPPPPPLSSLPPAQAIGGLLPSVRRPLPPLPVCDLPPPPPLRRTCALPGCDEHCAYCRENDRIAAENRDWNPFREPLPRFIPHAPAVWDLPHAGGVGANAGSGNGLAPPPIGAAVIRVPVDLRLMTAAALQELIAAANRVLADK